MTSLLARNFSLTKATGDWILIIDADEYITKDDFKKIRSTIKNTLFAGFQLLQRTYTNKSDQASWHPVAPEYPYSRGFFGYFDTPITRLFRNNSSFKFMGRVHEDITMSIKEQKLPLTVSDIIIHHYEYSRGKSFVKDKQLYYLELTLKKIKDQPTNPKSYYDAGIIYYNYKHDSDKALYYFRKALEVDTKYDVASNYVAKILAEKGNHEEAIHVLKSALELGSKNETTYINLGVIYMSLGRLDDALEIFKKASLINPQKITPYYNIGLVLVKQKQFGKAIDMFKKCLALNPTDGRVYLHLALLYQKINQPERAIKYYKALASSNHPHKEQFLKKIEELEHSMSEK